MLACFVRGAGVSAPARHTLAMDEDQAVRQRGADLGGVSGRMYKVAFYPVEMAMWEFA
ncbi:MAG: hypothetical protein QOF69_3782 [Solirubrobacteraceae bacterium]|jgi:hypothetical protein|nr:hypothetical protein [Solirubrobacteraceae bacterium]